MQESMKEAFQIASSKSAHRQKCDRDRHNKKTVTSQLQVGDRVLIWNLGEKGAQGN